MICPRCADAHIELMATSPVKGVWTVYQCQHCLYTWRDTETVTPYQPRTLSTSVSHDAKRY
ncbi:Hydroxyaromatic non-oxidative decarboxylaseprotein D [Salmonella enterica subsp. enterica]|uniref:Hydroxyaromatic non-oxidative decarboxylaseprotein D n=1 Tax=Salmonella enterica I TaxID=59201 RepID=A0A3S4IHC4_SALET|nr:Hydroxyaromatic non-oxidative decarboxylaseprotein D [Salmonella enterica subsp. enterica]VEB54896.1 Hydroxyaromatic non-oxidative decarboxylaseprotein D [Salmonella enterica subsp. enterica]